MTAAPGQGAMTWRRALVGRTRQGVGVGRERWPSGAVDVGEAAVKYQVKDLGTQGVSR